MEKMNVLAQALINEKFGMNKDETKLEQKALRSIKADSVSALGTDLKNSLEDVNVIIVDNKVYLQFDNEKSGVITLEVDIKVKSLDFDLDEVISAFEEKETEKAEKEAEKARVKAQKLAEKEAKKAKK